MYEEKRKSEIVQYNEQGETMMKSCHPRLQTLTLNLASAASPNPSFFHGGKPPNPLTSLRSKEAIGVVVTIFNIEKVLYNIAQSHKIFHIKRKNTFGFSKSAIPRLLKMNHMIHPARL